MMACILLISYTKYVEFYPNLEPTVFLDLFRHMYSERNCAVRDAKRKEKYVYSFFLNDQVDFVWNFRQLIYSC